MGLYSSELLHTPQGTAYFFGGEKVATLSLGQMPVQPVVQYPSEARAAGSDRTPSTHLLQLHLLNLYVLLSYNNALAASSYFSSSSFTFETSKKSSCFADKNQEV